MRSRVPCRWAALEDLPYASKRAGGSERWIDAVASPELLTEDCSAAMSVSWGRSDGGMAEKVNIGGFVVGGCCCADSFAVAIVEAGVTGWTDDLSFRISDEVLDGAG